MRVHEFFKRWFVVVTIVISLLLAGLFAAIQAGLI